MDNKIDKDVATTLKKKFDAHDTYGGTWHCIVGKNFGCSITHETQYSMFFEINGQHFLLFKSKDQIIIYIYTKGGNKGGKGVRRIIETENEQNIFVDVYRIRFLDLLFQKETIKNRFSNHREMICDNLYYILSINKQ